MAVDGGSDGFILGINGRFLMLELLPQRLLYASRCVGACVSAESGSPDSEDILLLFESGRYPVAYLPEGDTSPNTLQRTEHASRHHPNREVAIGLDYYL